MPRSAENPIATYFGKLKRDYDAGDSTEHTHRPALKTLIEALGRRVHATNEPRRIRCGAPDFIVSRGAAPVGHIEAKDVGINLIDAEESEQLHRYRESLANLILTDYVTFRWYVNGQFRLEASIGAKTRQGDLKRDPEGDSALVDLVTAFLNATTPVVTSASELARRMAGLATLVRNSIELSLADEEPSGSLHEQLEAFREVLLHDLDGDGFADMYAQTICYGLFTARANHADPSTFSRASAAYDLPRTNPFLRRMFAHIAGPDLDESIVWAVDDLVALLGHADIDAILADFANPTTRDDPVVHFYETFLHAYDPELRELRGVYFTPAPVVSYIVRSVDEILKTAFQLRDGLATSEKIRSERFGSQQAETHKVLILDPAAGTGTFLFEVVARIRGHLRLSPGLWSSYVSEHLLPRLFGFEILMAPYAVAHMKLGLELSESGYDFQTDERLRLFLTNTLEEPHPREHLPLFSQWLAQEASAASSVKLDSPVMVIVGNPPYSGHSANKGEWIGRLLHGFDTQADMPSQNYFEVDGEPLEERQVKWLNNDYVKFIRFAQWRIEQTGYGVLGFITDHGYLENLTFRGMRQSLMTTFDDIYVLDLHGSSKKGEVAPDGTVDENVFEIQQGVAIGFFVKRASSSRENARVWHAELWGKAEGSEAGPGKYDWLSDNSLATTEWTEVIPESPSYLFVPRDRAAQSEYHDYWPLEVVMPVHNVGFVTARDSFVLGFDQASLRRRLETFRRPENEVSTEEIKDQLDLRDTKTWSVKDARDELRRIKNWKQNLRECLYRPFDVRWIYYSSLLVERPVIQVMRHMLAGRNLGLITTRQTRDKWDCFVTDKICGHKSCAAYDINTLFPLYLYPTQDKPSLFDDPDAKAQVNLSPDFILAVARSTGLEFDPGGLPESEGFTATDLLAYIYGTLYTPAYRERYEEFLRTDYPRVPLPQDSRTFKIVGAHGRALIDLHTMSGAGTASVTFPVRGSDTVEEIFFEEGRRRGEGRVCINSTQYFEGVPEPVWEHRVGGFQVCERWLRDRHGRKLSYDELSSYIRLVQSLSATLDIMAELDRESESIYP